MSEPLIKREVDLGEDFSDNLQEFSFDENPLGAAMVLELNIQNIKCEPVALQFAEKQQISQIISPEHENTGLRSDLSGQPRAIKPESRVSKYVLLDTANDFNTPHQETGGIKTNHKPCKKSVKLIRIFNKEDPTQSLVFKCYTNIKGRSTGQKVFSILGKPLPDLKPINGYHIPEEPLPDLKPINRYHIPEEPLPDLKPINGYQIPEEPLPDLKPINGSQIPEETSPNQILEEISNKPSKNKPGWRSKGVYNCPHCEYKGISTRCVTRHVQYKHKLEKPAQCDICLKRFTEVYTMNKHRDVVHFNIKKLECQFCDFRTVKRSLLQYHEDANHLGVRYVCGNCGVRAVTVSQALSHARKVHGNEERPVKQFFPHLVNKTAKQSRNY